MKHSDHDLFSYPQAAGYTDPDTSKAAAKSTDAAGLRAKVMDALNAYGPMTADECAGRLGLSILSVRPRFTELRALGKIYDTHRRHRNESGKLAKVMCVCGYGVVGLPH